MNKKASSFFQDLPGLQILKKSKTPSSIYGCNLSSIYFHFQVRDEKGDYYIPLLDSLKKLIDVYVLKESEDQNSTEKLLYLLIRDVFDSKGFLECILSKFPIQTKLKFKDDITAIADRLPTDLFIKNSVANTQNRLNLENAEDLPEDSIFRLSINQKDEPLRAPEINSLSSYLNYDLAQKPILEPQDTLSLFEQFELYREKIPAFPKYSEFCEQISAYINSGKNENELLNDLLDTLGCEVFDFINEIVSHRNGRIDYSSPLDYTDMKAFMARRNQSKTTPAMASQIIVQSEEEKKMAKKIWKLEKKDKNKIEHEDLMDDFIDASLKPVFKKRVEVQETYPHVYDKKLTKSATIHAGVSIKLPENAIQKKNNLYSELTIPADEITKYKDDFKLVEISELDVIGQMVFRDIEKLNRIQSEVFPVAYNTNENLLICAPTGAGKTNIALLAMVHQIKAHMVDNMVQTSDFKIVYVSPMKALATEMVVNFSKKLSSIGVVVRELTGEMQMTRKQIAETHVIVSTPEKLDVITRKGAIDTEISSQMKLLIIDEVHLLNGSRGPVIETIVARMLRHVVSTQTMIRIVALSATLPGYLDVADFLKVNKPTGLFFFDNRFRAVPLTHTYVGVTNQSDNLEIQNKVCYLQIRPFVRRGQQVMVFVTARNQTTAAVNSFITQAKELGDMELFAPKKSARTLKSHFKNTYLHDLVSKGFGTHHAGMCRGDRLEIESLFREGHLKVIVCTATLAWGVNLPAHAVIIRGTSMYDAQQSKIVDMDVLDVLQIFGRAGRPQYDTSGHAVLVTSSSKIPFYMNMLMSQTPIESKFLDKLPDNLNGEIVLGTISNIREALEWLQSTYLFRRLRKNPINYGLTHSDLWESREYEFLQRQLEQAAETLEKAEMVRYDLTTGELRSTSYGRIASFLYITHHTLTLFLEKMTRQMIDDQIFLLISQATEFQQIQVRNDELEELDRLRNEYGEINVNLEVTTVEMKVLILIQTCISKGFIKMGSLVSDSEYIMQNVVRLAMALHQLAVERNYAALICRTLIIAQMLEQRTWHFNHPLAQFKDMDFKGLSALYNINIPVEEIVTMPEREIAHLTRNQRMAVKVLQCAKAFPKVTFDMTVKPITDGVIRIKLLISPNFHWDGHIHGGAQHYVAMVEDPMHDYVYHFEKFIITERICKLGEPIELNFTVPLQKPHSEEYFVKVINVHYLHTETQEIINFSTITLLPSNAIETKFLAVHPLPKSALRNKNYESLYKFNYFNAVQSQVFHCCYNTDSNVLLGAPTGSGKTIVSELCMLRLFTNNPERKVVYIAPMKALVRERVKDWTPKFKQINKNVVEITGDVTPKSELVTSAHIIITTPEKWDGMSRNWFQKDFVKNVGLVIIDEIHLLAEDRGPVLEVIVSRMNYINAYTDTTIRIIGLSTAMANAGDLANWLGVSTQGLFNFSSAVRPVPLEIHVTGFAGKNYCPRMATMNKPAYQAICQYAPNSPVLIFVSSRKQTRITSHELVKLLMLDVNDKQWLKCSTDEIDYCRSQIVDNDLSYMLQFGIAIHHAGLQEKDRDIVEELFVNQKIQVLIATATLAWGVNFPAHLVIVKGTEYYDGASKRYVDMPVTDVLQMLGRAGRPQFDNNGVACVFVEESKKSFYRKFLFEPFPVESCLLKVLPEHVNAEIANRTVSGREQLVDFICSTFFFRRLLINPSYYKRDDADVGTYLKDLADSVANTLYEAGCVDVFEGKFGDVSYETTHLGHLAAKYYLSYKTIVFLNNAINEDTSVAELLMDTCQVEEYSLFPVRHNEDKINRQLVKDLNLQIKLNSDSPHLKVYLLVYCYINGIDLPNQEYVIDLKTVFDQIIRIIQAMISLVAHKGWLDCLLKLIYISQMILQGIPVNNSALFMLPHVGNKTVNKLTRALIGQGLIFRNQFLTLPVLVNLAKTSKNEISNVLTDVFDSNKQKQIVKILLNLPSITIDLSIKDETNSTLKTVLQSNEFYYEARIKPKTLFELCLAFERKGGRLNVFSRRFSKQKDESWFLLISKDNRLEDFQRFSFKSNKYYQIQFTSPSERGIYKYVIWFLSDSYIGLDQQVVLQLSVS